MPTNNEIKIVFIGDLAYNTNITPLKKQTSLGGGTYLCAIGAEAAAKQEDITTNEKMGVVARVGNDFTLSDIRMAHLDTSGIAMLKDQLTCRFVALQHADNTRTVTANRNVAEKVDTSIFPSEYQLAEYFHLATSLPQHYLIWLDFLEKLPGKVSADAFEIYAEQYPEETLTALNRSDIIFLNEVEANTLEQHGHIRNDIPWVLKKGARGASYIENGREISISASKVTAIETSGAGDSLAGAFLYLLSCGYELEFALRVATNIASQSVTKFGVEHLLE